MYTLYNVCDTAVNISCNEGFGLANLEMMMTGRPTIAIKTGGLTRQVEDLDTGEQYGIGLDPEVKTLVGNQMVPYIFEDFVSNETVAKAYMDMYEWGPEKRKEVGLRALEHANKDYSMTKLVSEWDRTLTDLCKNWKNSKRWEKIEL